VILLAWFFLARIWGEKPYYRKAIVIPLSALIAAIATSLSCSVSFFSHVHCAANRQFYLTIISISYLSSAVKEIISITFFNSFCKLVSIKALGTPAGHQFCPDSQWTGILCT